MLDVYRVRRDNLRRLLGEWDDPLADIRRNVRWAVGLGAVALVLALADLLA